MRPVNLLPESQRRRAPAGDGKSAYAVLGVLAVLLAMTAAYVTTANQATERAAAAAEAAAEAERLEAQIASLGAFGNFAQIKEMRIASVRQLAAQRFDWERLMLELARVLPDDGWLKTASASTSGESDDTGTASASVGGVPTATLEGCLRYQSDVADLMLRLRRLHRAEDVSLTESAREDAQEAPSVDGCGRYYRFEIAVTFAPTVVDESPDGQPRVPASLGGGS
ncbi:MAG TPA: PilN domain-containing protein [Thermoleophilaceae bacterium]|nr:PilN domain-containing protein [Thermoleophilaceae bacterium]